MNKKNNNKNPNSSMFLYTALIFIVALILIIIAFFGQKNIMNLRRTTDAMGGGNQQEEVLIEETSTDQPSNDEFAVMSNTISNLQSENTALKDDLDIYEKLLAANGYAESGSMDKANEILSGIDASRLTSDQLILYNQLLNTIDEGKE